MATGKAEDLRSLRKQNNLSRNEVATALGVTGNAVTNYENGLRTILYHIFSENNRILHCKINFHKSFI